jgi:hypothetical protein
MKTLTQGILFALVLVLVNAYLSVVLAANKIPIPIPLSVWLFGSGLLGMIWIARRKK